MLWPCQTRNISPSETASEKIYWFRPLLAGVEGSIHPHFNRYNKLASTPPMRTGQGRGRGTCFERVATGEKRDMRN